MLPATMAGAAIELRGGACVLLGTSGRTGARVLFLPGSPKPCRLQRCAPPPPHLPLPMAVQFPAPDGKTDGCVRVKNTVFKVSVQLGCDGLPYGADY